MRNIIILLWDKLLSLLPGVKPYPRVLQFPITGVCNSACATCSVPSRAPNVELTVPRVREILQNDLFKKLEAVGINGGEPTLVADLPGIAEEILRLPRIKSIHMISNGTLTERLLTATEQIQKQCKAKGVLFSLSISFDGVGPIYRACRGMLAFEDVLNSIEHIIASPGVYCQEFSAGCTVSKYNVHHLIELDSFCSERGIPIFYRIAVANKRIHNLHYSDDFSVLSQEPDRMAAQEFFFGKVMEKGTWNFKRKFTYYAIFKYLESHGRIRLADCFWQWRDATVDERGNLYYCATRSKNLGMIEGDNAADLFFSKEHLDYRRQLVEQHCQKCIHYAFAPTLRGAFSFFKFFVHLFFFPIRYRFMGRAR